MTTSGMNRLDEAEWGRLIQDTAVRFDDLTLKRGFQLYKQGLIRSLDADSAPGYVQAVAEEGAGYRVQIQLNAPEESLCECSSELPCKHQAAALMAFAESRGRSVHVLANARSAQHMAAAAGGYGEEEASDEEGLFGGSGLPGSRHVAVGRRPEARLREQAGRLPGMSVSQWQGWIASCAERATSSPYQSVYNDEVRSIVRGLRPELEPAEEWLFELNVALFLLRKQSSGGHSGYFAHLAASETANAISRLLGNDSPPEESSKGWERLLETAAYIRDAAIADAMAPPAYLDVYAELWLRRIAPAAEGRGLFEEELTRLLEAEEAANAGEDDEPGEQARRAAGSAETRERRTVNKLFPLVARAWMHFWLGEDRQAWRRLETAERHRLKPEHVFRFLRALADRGEWTRLEAWLGECAAELVGRRYNSLDEYGRYWDAVLERLPEAEERMWSAIAGSLPYSGSLYEEKLLQRGRWRQWIDYQLSLGSDPLDHRAKDLQPLEKEAPETLLPFYHQGVERYVLLKNRDGYKRAVKLLKRLAKLYKKLKREERWEAYLDAFAGRHSRLRALQEELRKGKLIP